MTSPGPPLGRVGRYELRRELGRGSMGLVYEAWDPELGRRIALKMLQPAVALQAEVRAEFEQRFLVEARAAARLQHPGIVVVHDVGRDLESGLAYMALEYLEGETLAEVIRVRAPLPWPEAVRLALGVAEALAQAHAQGVLHRDVKPANIMLLPSGLPKLMDFGIAKLEDAGLELTVAGQALGTPLYMSPELALGLQADARSDLFSLGAILYTLVTGRLAFAAEDVPRIVWRVVHDEPEPAGRLVAGLPTGLGQVLERALAKPPAARYSSARDFADDLADVLGGCPARHACVPLSAGEAFSTRVSGADAPLDGLLLEELPAVPAAPDDPLAGLVSKSKAEPSAPRSGRPRGLPREVGFTLLALLAAWPLLLGAWWLSRLGGTRSAPTRTTAADTHAGPTPAEATAAPAADESGPAKLALDFEHPLRAGTLEVRIDDELVLEQALEGRVTRSLPGIGLKLRQGGLEKTFEVAPGRHTIDVEVRWDDNVKRETIAGTFKGGNTRRLEARVGRLRKGLSLEWR